MVTRAEILRQQQRQLLGKPTIERPPTQFVEPSPVQQQQQREQQQAVGFLRTQITQLQTRIAELDRQRDELRRAGHTKDVAQLGITRNELNAGLQQARSLLNQSDKYVITRLGAEKSIAQAQKQKRAFEVASAFQLKQERRFEAQKNIVFIDGQGFSVKPELQEEFIKQQRALRQPTIQEQPFDFAGTPLNFLETVEKVKQEEVAREVIRQRLKQQKGTALEFAREVEAAPSVPQSFVGSVRGITEGLTTETQLKRDFVPPSTETIFEEPTGEPSGVRKLLNLATDTEATRRLIFGIIPKEIEAIRTEDKLLVDIDKFNMKAEKYSSDVESFNKKFGDKQLTQSQQTKAQGQFNSLEERRVKLEQDGTSLEKNADEINSRTSIAKIGIGMGLIRAGIGFISGLAQTPQFLFGAAVSPIGTAIQVGKGIIHLPETIARDPFGTVGEILGGLKGAKIVFRAAGRIVKEPTVREVVFDGIQGIDAEGNVIARISYFTDDGAAGSATGITTIGKGGKGFTFAGVEEASGFRLDLVTGKTIPSNIRKTFALAVSESKLRAVREVGGVEAALFEQRFIGAAAKKLPPPRLDITGKLKFKEPAPEGFIGRAFGVEVGEEIFIGGVTKTGADLTASAGIIKKVIGTGSGEGELIIKGAKPTKAQLKVIETLRSESIAKTLGAIPPSPKVKPVSFGESITSTSAAISKITQTTIPTQTITAPTSKLVNTLIGTRTRERVKTSQVTKAVSQQRERAIQITGVLSQPRINERLSSITGIGSLEQQKQRKATQVALSQLTRPTTRLTGITTFGLLTPPPTIPRPVRIPLKQPKVKPTITKFPSYNVLVKSKGKYIRANKVPLSKSLAQSLGAFVTDRSLSAQFKLKPTSKKAKTTKLNFPKNYFTSTRNKFRDYKIRKGRKVPMKNQYIEKAGRRLDTLSEKKQIRAAKLIASIRKPKKTKKKKPVRRRQVRKGLNNIFSF